MLGLWNGQLLCGSPGEQFVNYESGFPYRDSFILGGLASTTPPSFQLPERALASQEERVLSLELRSSHEIVLF